VNPADSFALLPPLLAAVGLDPHPVREKIRVWARSGVERLRFPGGGSTVFKYAEEPFDREHLVLREAADAGVPVPAVLAAHTVDGLLGMLLEDLGQSVREAEDRDGVEAAVTLHRAPFSDRLTRLDTAALAALPGRMLARAERCALTQLSIAAASELAKAAESRARGADLAPFGWCHSEFHPTSVFITKDGWRLLDFARAFIGPGLLDLASWHGTLDAPDTARLAAFLDQYVRAGGARSALDERGGLSAAAWALGWHRLWVAEWFSEQIERGWAGEHPATWTQAIERHTREAAELLL
jgi:aminoglycoside phosphotransferase (APT) family kinase protein